MGGGGGAEAEELRGVGGIGGWGGWWCVDVCGEEVWGALGDALFRRGTDFFLDAVSCSADLGRRG